MRVKIGRIHSQPREVTSRRCGLLSNYFEYLFIYKSCIAWKATGVRRKGLRLSIAYIVPTPTLIRAWLDTDLSYNEHVGTHDQRSVRTALKFVVFVRNLVSDNIPIELVVYY